MMTTAVMRTDPAEPSRLAAGAADLDTIQLRVLAPAPPRWYPGLVRPEVAHLLSTHDGRARLIEIDGRQVAVGVCGTATAWATTVEPVELSSLESRQEPARCATCDRVYRDLFYHAGLGDDR